jgi:hypothetical protein
MKHLAGWAVLAGLMGLAAAAHAQTVVPVSDFGRPGPYAAMPPDPLWPGYGPRLLPPREIRTIAHERGFAALGNPQQRGIVYTISAIDPDGEDGKLVIDARSGRIIRFMPAYRMGDRFNEELDTAYGPVGPLPPLPASARRVPRPPLPIPHVTRRSAAPLPKPAPPQQSAQAPAVAPSVEARPPAPIQPTQQMPTAQGLD